MRLLVVEDNQTIASSLKKGLSQESFAVDVAADGEVGLDMAVSESYDLIILDVMLPLMDGFEVCQKIRDEGISVPILMLTARDAVVDKVEGLNGGADDYLVKPFDFDELLARVRALLRRPLEQKSLTLKYSDIEIDTLNKTVTRNNQPIALSKKEFALLEYLMRNSNQVLTKDQLMQHVWEYDADILPNTVEVYIGYLRNKIDKPFKAPRLIKTIRGFGYQLGGA